MEMDDGSKFIMNETGVALQLCHPLVKTTSEKYAKFTTTYEKLLNLLLR